MLATAWLLLLSGLLAGFPANGHAYTRGSRASGRCRAAFRLLKDFGPEHVPFWDKAGCVQVTPGRGVSRRAKNEPYLTHKAGNAQHQLRASYADHLRTFLRDVARSGHMNTSAAITVLYIADDNATLPADIQHAMERRGIMFATHTHYKCPAGGSGGGGIVMIPDPHFIDHRGSGLSPNVVA